MPAVNTTTTIPAIHAQVARELERATLQKCNTPRIAIQMQSKATLNLVTYTLQLNTINDEPNLKTFRDSL
jgi:hypothetical protein